MPDAFAFESVTDRFGLPLLFAGQAQKEVFHNEALARVDALMHSTVEGETSEPPEEPDDGKCWLVGPAATGAWTAQDGSIAMRQAGHWQFAAPVPGLRIYDLTTAQFSVFSDGWQKPASIAEPTGGIYVDSEARVAIGTLISALRAAGVLPSA